MPAPSWDLAIGVFFLIGMAFGYILQREKIIATLLATYVSLVITTAIAGNVFDFFQGSSTIGSFWIQSQATPLSVRIILFIVIIVLLSAKGGISGSKAKGIMSPIEIFIISFLTTGLILSSIFYFMPIESRDAFVASSRFANLIIKYYLGWVIVPPIILIVLGFTGKRSDN